MAENDQAQEKTEDPTQRRLEKAREDGDVLSSKEMFVFASSFSGLLVITGLGMFSNQILDSWSTLFSFSRNDDLSPLTISNGWASLKIILLASALFGLPSICFILLTQFIVGGGLSLNAKSLYFKTEKINLIKGLGRIFSVKGLAELIKSVFKVILLTTVVVGFLWFTVPQIIYLNTTSLIDALQVIYRLLLLLILTVLIILTAIAIGDYFWSRHTWLSKLRMSRQDMKEEFKESEGSPEVKARMRRLQMEASQRAMQQNEAIESVKDATVIITNPSHFAVALKYNQDEDIAPIIVASGRDRVAHRIIEKANENSKTIVRVPPLARALYFTGTIGETVSERLYSAVATILAYVYQLERGVEADLQDIELPDELMFDEDGNKSGS